MSLHAEPVCRAFVIVASALEAIERHLRASMRAIARMDARKRCSIAFEAGVTITQALQTGSACRLMRAHEMQGV